MCNKISYRLCLALSLLPSSGPPGPRQHQCKGGLLAYAQFCPTHFQDQTLPLHCATLTWYHKHHLSSRACIATYSNFATIRECCLEPILSEGCVGPPPLKHQLLIFFLVSLEVLPLSANSPPWEIQLSLELSGATTPLFRTPPHRIELSPTSEL